MQYPAQTLLSLFFPQYDFPVRLASLNGLVKGFRSMHLGKYTPSALFGGFFCHPLPKGSLLFSFSTIGYPNDSSGGSDWYDLMDPQFHTLLYDGLHFGSFGQTRSKYYWVQFVPLGFFCRPTRTCPLLTSDDSTVIHSSAVTQGNLSHASSRSTFV